MSDDPRQPSCVIVPPFFGENETVSGCESLPLVRSGWCGCVGVPVIGIFSSTCDMWQPLERRDDCMVCVVMSGGAVSIARLHSSVNVVFVV